MAETRNDDLIDIAKMLGMCDLVGGMVKYYKERPAWERDASYLYLSGFLDEANLTAAEYLSLCEQAKQYIDNI